MDRRLVYPGELPASLDVLDPQVFSLEAMSNLAWDVMLSTLNPSASAAKVLAAGFKPSFPGGMQVKLDAGRVYSMLPIDATAFSVSGVNERVVLQQGKSDGATLSFAAAPATAGHSRIDLIQVALLQQDTNFAVLPYYNSANPEEPLPGPDGTGEAQPLDRKVVAQLPVKSGVPAASPVAPAPDAGNAALFYVTVANGVTVLTSAHVTVPANAAFIGGLTSQHHTGAPGSAPKLVLGNETQGNLPSVQLPTGSATFSWDNANKRLGIGRATPLHALDVVGGGRFTDFLVSNLGFYLDGALGITKDGSNNVFLDASANTSLHLQVGSGTKVYIDNVGRVGIGALNPEEKLHVSGSGLFAGNIRLTGSSHAAPLVVGDVDGDASHVRLRAGYTPNVQAWVGVRGNWNGESDAGGFIDFATRGTERMRVTENGNVGVGTSEPLRTLHVAGYDGVALMLSNMSLAAGYKHWALTPYGGDLRLQHVDDAGTVSKTPVTFARSGWLGLGVTNPSSELHLEGIAQIRRFSSYGQASFTQHLYLGLNNDANNNGATKGFLWSIDKAADVGAHAALVLSEWRGFNNVTTGTYPVNDWAAVLTIRGGRLGIGQASPETTLHLAGSMRMGPDGNSMFSITREFGYSGVTLDANAYYSHANGWRRQEGNSWALQFDYHTAADASAGWTFNSAAPNGTHDSGLGWNTVARMTADGRLGLGVGTPDAKLHIAGDFAGTYLKFGRHAGASAFGDDVSLDFVHTNEVNQLTGNPAVRLAAYLHGGGNNFGFRLYTREHNTLVEQVRIFPNGYFGIGTTEPTANLHVGNQHAGADHMSTVRISGRKTEDGVLGLLAFSNSNDAGGATAYIQARRTGNNYATVLDFYTRDIDLSERHALTLGRNGYVGVNTTDPTAKFEVAFGSLGPTDARNSFMFEDRGGVGDTGALNLALKVPFAYGNGVNLNLTQGYLDLIKVHHGNTILATASNDGRPLGAVGIGTTSIKPATYDGISPTLDIVTGLTSGEYSEGIVIRHPNNDGGAVNRSFVLMFKHSTEDNNNESSKWSGLRSWSNKSWANEPDLDFIANGGVGIARLWGDGEGLSVGTIAKDGTGAKLQVNGPISEDGEKLVDKYAPKPSGAPAKLNYDGSPGDIQHFSAVYDLGPDSTKQYLLIAHWNGTLPAHAVTNGAVIELRYQTSEDGVSVWTNGDVLARLRATTSSVDVCVSGNTVISSAPGARYVRVRAFYSGYGATILASVPYAMTVVPLAL